MTRAELGISRGYGGIWNDIEPAEPYKIPNYKYEMVLDYDHEDMMYKDLMYVPRPEAKKKYFVHGTHLYKLVNPDGELPPWLDGVDPLAE